MKTLKLSSLLLITILLSACHSTELTLRHSKVKKYTPLQDACTQESLALSPAPSNISNASSPTTTVQSTNTPDNSTSVSIEETSDISEKKAPALVEKVKENPHKNLAEHQALPKHYKQVKASAKKNKQHINGVFGGIGHAFGVVGLVFLFVGIILFLIGGLIIDTLGALFIGFGFLFLLIWLVLIILQVVFDVIL